MTTFNIPNMSCGHCKATVQKTIHAIDPEAQIEFDMALRTIALESRAKPDNLQVALAAAGYPATLA
ncbi:MULTISPECIES: heavy-metal-associated domain-containing protein [unclassified Paracoccus (in: a-proteobacteria)]|jgi:copper chaperone|uniref:Heavy-metal-associated domain-containing protein n=1 Tax=Ponticaulis profundi TaxID=2665222 RepID=A0ABW1SE34_9PROT|nr:MULTISPECIES: heavy-metal-associated domain-containing protein [unclassified Paracoccus (in: a-proteobacteria)]AZY95929.1 copper chaperone [Paracoccus sp. Arc7-R13]KIX16384.1 heavy metal transport/detoxification protein [Paracoccus sp. 228]